MRLRPFILCFNRTGKQGAKASETGHDREGNTHPKRLSSSSSERYSPGLFIHRPQTPQRWFERASAGTHATPAPKRAHSGSHAETRGVSDGGWYHYPRSVLRGSETLRGRVSERRTLPLLGLGRMYSQRTQKAFVTAMRMMRVAVTRRRGPAGLRDPMAVSLHRGTPRFWSTVITECREKHTSFLCAELFCQLCLRLPPLCCTL